MEMEEKDNYIERKLPGKDNSTENGVCLEKEEFKREEGNTMFDRILRFGRIMILVEVMLELIGIIVPDSILEFLGTCFGYFLDLVMIVGLIFFAAAYIYNVFYKYM